MISHKSFEPGEDHLPYRKALAGHDFGFGDVKEEKNNMNEVKRRNPARPKKDVKSAATKTGAKNQHPKKSTTQHTITLGGLKLSMPLKTGILVSTTEMRLNILRGTNTKGIRYKILKRLFGICNDT